MPEGGRVGAGSVLVARAGNSAPPLVGFSTAAGVRALMHMKLPLAAEAVRTSR
jgi:hypothetical protein